MSINEHRPAHVPESHVLDFDIYSPPDVGGDIYESWHSLQREGIPDIVWTPRNEGHWIPTKSAIVKEILDDFATFSNSNLIIPKSHGEAYKVLPGSIDPPEHNLYRRVMSIALSPKVVRQIEPRIRNISRELIDAFKNDSECDFVKQYAEILPIKMFMTLMDLPMDDVPQTKYWANQMFRPTGDISFSEAFENLKQYLIPYMKERYGKDGDDMLSLLINSEVNGERVTWGEALELAVQALVAGLDTVVSFFGFAFYHLANNPQDRSTLLNRPDVIPAAADELFRRYPVATIARQVAKDTFFYGVQLKAGDMMVIPTLLQAKDAQFNDLPDKVDFERKKSNSINFGSGPHVCPGKHLARMEVIVTLEEWFKEIPEFSLKDGYKLKVKSGVVSTIESLPLVW